MSAIVDLCCPCPRCVDHRAAGSEVIEATVICDTCKSEYTALNLSGDAWPMFFDCPWCERSRGLTRLCATCYGERIVQGCCSPNRPGPCCGDPNEYECPDCREHA